MLDTIFWNYQRRVSIAHRNGNQLGKLTNYLADSNESVSKRITGQKVALGLKQVLFHQNSVLLLFQGGIQKDNPGKENPIYVT